MHTGEVTLHEKARQDGGGEHDDGQGMQDRQKAHHGGKSDAAPEQRDRRPDDSVHLVELVLGVSKLVVESGALEERDVEGARLLDEPLLGGEFDALEDHALHHVGHRTEQRLGDPQREDDAHGHKEYRPVAAAGGDLDDAVDDHLGHVDDRGRDQGRDHHDRATDREQSGRDLPEESIDPRHDAGDIAQFATQTRV